jgi:hypothetical protein
MLALPHTGLMSRSSWWPSFRRRPSRRGLPRRGIGGRRPRRDCVAGHRPSPTRASARLSFSGITATQ